MEAGDLNWKFPPCPHQVLDSISDPPLMLNFEGLQQEISNGSPRLQSLHTEETAAAAGANGWFHQPEKKRRLSPEKVHFLERSFEVENKLEPERKINLAKKLGLQPRQVAIWFQNRRARFRTKLIEKEFDSLKASYDKLRDDLDAISRENGRLRHEVQLLKEKLKSKEEEEKEHEKKQKAICSSILLDRKSLSMLMCKQEDASSAKSGILDSDEPADSSIMEPADSLHDEDGRLFHTPCFLKLDDLDYDLDHELQMPSNYSFNLGFSISDQTHWLWGSG